MKKVVAEVVADKARLEELEKKEEELTAQVDELQDALAKATANVSLGYDEKLDEVRAEHSALLSKTIDDMESKFKVELNQAMKEKDEEMEREKDSHNIVTDALEEEVKYIRKELESTEDKLKTITEEHALCDYNREEAVGEIEKKVEALQSKLESEQKAHKTAIQEVQKECQAECLKSQQLQAQLDSISSDLHSKDTEISNLEIKLEERTALNTKEQERMKSHLSKLHSLVESSSADRDRAKAEIAQLKLQIETQSESIKMYVKYDEESKVEIGRLKSILERSTKEVMLRCVESSEDGSFVVECLGGSGSREEGESKEEVASEATSEKVTASVERSAKSIDDSVPPRTVADGALQQKLEDVQQQRDKLLVEVETLKNAAARVRAAAADASGFEIIKEVVASFLPAADVAAKKTCIATLHDDDDEVASLPQDPPDDMVAQIKIMAAIEDRVDSMKRERDYLASEIKNLEESLRASTSEEEVVTTTAVDGDDAVVVSNESVEPTLDAKILESSLEDKKTELKSLEEKFATSVRMLTSMRDEHHQAMTDMKNKIAMFESVEEERDQLSAELTRLKASTELPDDSSAAAKLGEELSNLKLEHRVEVKLLKKDHASTKTKVKLLKAELQKIGMEKEEMLKAYDMERQSNNELEKSLEEMVTMMESERVLHADQVEVFRTKLESMKHKYIKMRKKRVPVDAAFRASRILLDRLENSVTVEGATGGIVQPSRIVEMDASLTEAMAEAKSELESEIQRLQQDKVNAIDTLAEMSKDYEAEIEFLKSSIEEKEAENDKLRQYLARAKATVDELETSVENHVHRDVETINNLETELRETREKRFADLGTMGTQQAVIDELKGKLDACESELTKLKEGHSNEVQDYMKQATDDAQCHLATIERLQRQLEESSADAKQELKSEVDRLKSEFNEVIEAFEKELVDTCDSNANAISEKTEEIESLKDKLRAAEESISTLEERVEQLTSDKEGADDAVVEELKSELEIAKETSSASEAALDELKRELAAAVETLSRRETAMEELKVELATAKETQTILASLEEHHSSLVESGKALEAEKHQLAESLAKAKESRKEVEEKLQTAMITVDESMKAYEELRTIHESLQKECSLLKADVSKLTSEKDTLSGQTKDQAEQYGKLRDDYFALEKQCNSVAEERSSLESLVAKLTDEKENLEAQSEQHKTAALVVEAELRTKKDETKAALDESRKANQRLDEMLAYCEKLKKVNQEQATKLKKDLEEQTTSLNEVIQSLSNQIKSIEAEKEQNRTMYETDIELQQSVSFFVMYDVWLNCPVFV